ncbi:MAG: TlpA family protein disulfide reductase [Betaproteobacteria bacterium]|nr:TlpA family protein disulfide reductase [Betaproteobacteria bacterium]
MNIRVRLWLFATTLILLLGQTGLAHAQVGVGDPLPETEVRLLDGTIMPQARLRGKVVLTVFWATWCPICMRELSDYQVLYDRHHAAGLEIVALSVDRDASAVQDYVRATRLFFPVAMRTPELKSAWGPVQGTPLLYLSDRAGIVRLRHLGAPGRDALENAIMPLLDTAFHGQ